MNQLDHDSELEAAFVNTSAAKPVPHVGESVSREDWLNNVTSRSFWTTCKAHPYVSALALLLVCLALWAIWRALTPQGAPAAVADKPPAVISDLQSSPIFDVNAAKRQQAKRGGKATPPAAAPKPTDYEPWTPAPLPEPVPDLPAVAIAKAPEAPVRPAIPLTARQQAYEDRQAGRSLSFNQEK